jgi:hypothetical protein
MRREAVVGKLPALPKMLFNAWFDNNAIGEYQSSFYLD